MKHLFILLVVLLSFAAAAQSGNDRAIRRLLQQQTEAWNRGDLEGFMQTYWKSDSLMFVGRNGVNMFVFVNAIVYVCLCVCDCVIVYM